MIPAAVNPAIVLASASPRRAALLRQLRIPFEQVVSPVGEPECGDGDPEAHVVAAARAKARAVAELVRRDGARVAPAAHRRGAALVVGADTLVCCDGLTLGKPRDREEALRTLSRLSGREHAVYTGLAVVGPAGQERSACEVTRVRVAALSTAAAVAYVDSREPLDKAGSYGIQGRGARFIERVEGCYYNVVGLPLFRLCCLLESAGYDLDPIQDAA